MLQAHCRRWLRFSTPALRRRSGSEPPGRTCLLIHILVPTLHAKGGTRSLRLASATDPTRATGVRQRGATGLVPGHSWTTAFTYPQVNGLRVAHARRVSDDGAGCVVQRTGKPLTCGDASREARLRVSGTQSGQTPDKATNATITPILAPTESFAEARVTAPTVGASLRPLIAVSVPQGAHRRDRKAGTGLYVCEPATLLSLSPGVR